MIIENKGLKTEKFYLPPFKLNEGEIVIIKLLNDITTSETENTLIELLCGEKKNENIDIYKQLTFVKNKIKLPFFYTLFHKLTVGKYLKINSNIDNEFSKKIYEIDWISSKTLIERLAGGPRKKLSLYATLSKNKYILFDLIAIDNKNRNEIFEIVRKSTKNYGAAILIDCHEGLEKVGDKHIELKYY
jgi:ABC-type lipoprotein export system ATPase subunit